MDPDGPETKNYCAGEDQQQIIDLALADVFARIAMS
jgi:hypothetical protein